LINCKREPYPSISSVYESWLLAKENMSIDKIDDFQRSIKNFYTSPVGSLYFIHSSNEMIRLEETLDSILERLKTAQINSNNEEVYKAILEIDRAIDLLRRMDTQFSDTSQLHLFFLFFFFSLLIIGIILVLQLMHTRIEKAESREQESLVFSRETIMAQEQERKRIAKDLHDTALQDLWRLSFLTENIGQTEDSVERNRLCREVVSEQKEVMKQIRNICDHLIPPDFHLRRLDEILLSYLYKFEQSTGIECHISIQDNLDFSFLHGDKQLHCFRIVQECLANIEKHSSAAKVSFFIRSSLNELLICITDNGIGFSTDKKSGRMYDKDYFRKIRSLGHFGFWNMHERSASLGGTLKIESEGGEGTSITLRIPLVENSAQRNKA
jgi:signal transduction histidine kinase